MIEAFAIGVSAKLEDGVTPPLLRIIDSLMKANELMLEFSANVRNLSKAGASLATNLGKAATASNALGDSNAGLTRASYILDTMAVSSGDVARNLEAARVAGAGMLPVGQGGGAGTGGVRRSRGGSGAAVEGGVIGAALGAVGVVKNWELDDTLTKAAAIQNLPPGQLAARVSQYHDHVMQWYREYGAIANGGVKSFGEAFLTGERLGGFLPTDKARMELMDAIAPWAARESKQKHISFDSAMESFINIAHQTGAQDAASFTKIAPALYEASIKSEESLKRITNASSYALPQAIAAGYDPAVALASQIVLSNAGVNSTKKGTWLRALELNAFPKMSAANNLIKDGKKKDALTALGLLDHGKITFLDEDGKPNEVKLLTSLAKAQQRLSKTPGAFASDVTQAFMTQGASAAMILTEKQNLGMLLNAITQIKEYDAAAQKNETAALSNTDISKGKRALTDLTVTTMNVGRFLSPAAETALNGLGSLTKWMADHPAAGGAVLTGTAAGIGWAAAKGAFKPAAIAEAVGVALEILSGPAGVGIAAAAAGVAAAWWVHNNATIKGDMAAMNPNYHRPNVDDPNIRTAAGEAERARLMKEYGMQPPIQVNVNMDSHAISSHLIPSKPLGPAGINHAAHPLPPGMNLGWGGH